MLLRQPRHGRITCTDNQNAFTSGSWMVMQEDSSLRRERRATRAHLASQIFPQKSSHVPQCCSWRHLAVARKGWEKWGCSPKKSSLKESGVTYLVSQFKIQHTRRCQSRLSGKILDKNHLMKIGLSNKELSWFGLPAHFQRQGEGGGAGSWRAGYGKLSSGSI